MMKNQTFESDGFTLMEMVVTIAIFALIAYGITLLITGMINNSGFQSKILDNNDLARKTATAFTNEMRGCVVSATGSFPIESAGNQSIIFYTQTATTINRIRYFLQNGKLYKGVIVPTGSPAIYNPANETVTIAADAMATGVAEDIFTYYDDSGSALASPVNITQIRNIQINLKIYLQGSRNAVGTYNVTASATVRNLKDNL